MNLKKLFQLVPELKEMFIKSFSLAIVIEVFKFVPPFVLMFVVNNLISSTPSIFYLITALIIMLASYFITTFLEDNYNLLISRNIFGVETSVLKKAHDRILRLDMGYHESHPSGELVHLLNNGSTKLKELIWYIQEQMFGASIQIILTTVILIYINKYVGLLFFIFIPVTIYFSVWSAKKLQPYRRKYHKVFKDATWEMNQSIINIRTVKDYVQENKEKEKYQSLLDDYFNLALKRIEFEGNHHKYRDSLLGISRFSILFYCIYFVLNNAMSTGTLVLFSTLSEKVLSSMYRLGRLYSFLGDAIESINQLWELLNEKPTVKDSLETIAIPDLQGEFQMLNASFSYGDDNEILENINIKIPPKKVCAIVGRSGAGKSTIIKLILRHYDVSEGAILLDGMNIQQFKVKDYRSKIGVVTQDVEIFDLSIKDNISYGIDASIEEIIEASKKAYAHDFIQKLPEGYETRVGERGIRLSGGQKQRVGIARALIKKPALLIFDEATSSLDSESEKMIQKALHEISNFQTMIIIAHRLSTIEHADIIVVLDDGKVAESGNYQELIDLKGLFHKMVSMQGMGDLRE